MLPSIRRLFNYNKLSFDSQVDEKLINLRLLNSNQLKNFKQRPLKCKLLARDFIDDSLYNPNYGYFNKNVEIINYSNIQFNKVKNDSHLQSLLSTNSASSSEWHTPTELFNPHYGQSIANYIVNHYLLHYYPYHDLNIFEIGAGNGTLMLNILDHLKSNHKHIYKQTNYNIIEISDKLSSIQRKLLTNHSRHINIINKSFFDINSVHHQPCYFLAMEVFDNLAHDVIRYSNESKIPTPYQLHIAIDDHGDFHSLYSPADDPLILRYLDLTTSQPSQPSNHWLSTPALRNLSKFIPFLPNLSQQEFLPTKQLLFLDKLSNSFPNHHLIASDFDSLPQSITGINSPVVQTRLNGEMIPVDTFLVQPGHFDIFFPTNFHLLAQLYKQIINPNSFFTSNRVKRDVKILSHKQFIQSNAIDINKTRLLDGSNPMLDYYNNASFILT